MNWELWIRLAGVGLLLIAVANFIAPYLLDYAGNLRKVDKAFGQVFRVHAAYTILVVVAMAAVCLWKPAFFLDEEMGRFAAGFLAFFWGSRLCVQLFYYDRGLKGRFPIWNVVFAAGFLALAVGFTTIAFLP